MSRWHRRDCRDPVVFVIDSNPSCKSCGGVFSLDENIVLQNDRTGSCAERPEDEPYGQMNLWWPRSVAYTNASSESASKECATATEPSNDTLSAIREDVYGDNLPQGSFRLACLYACQDSTDPIHIELETHRISHRPDYETVSYVWGGETGDAVPRRPVFIGRYWDVFLQTENCYELLRFARPGRGIRWLWVDAVCINQNNNLERTAQVAMMHQIYSECLRCLVYLGPDVVHWHGNQWPGRRGLHELVRDSCCDETGTQASGDGLQRLLKERRYFSRLWVIQELVLSSKVIIPIGDTVYWADSTTDRKIRDAASEGWDYHKTAAPWVQNICQQTLSTQLTCESLLSTRQTYCSDPRDRLFGLLGLLGSNTARGPNAPLQANYALSNQHVWVGFFAHSILNEGAIWLLYNAAGHKAPASAPSWAPLWNQAATWSNLSCPDNDSDNLHLKVLESRRMPTKFCESYVGTRASGLGGLWDFESPAMNQDIRVDARTGSLLGVRAVLLFTFLQKPKVGENLENLTIFHSWDSGFVEIASREPLDQVVQPLTDQLFMFRIGLGSIVFLVLRDLGKEHSGRLYDEKCGVVISPPSRYRLVATCHALFFCNRNPHSSLAWSGPTPMCVSFLERTGNLQDTIDELRNELNKDIEDFVIFAPLVRDRWALLPLAWYASDGLNSSTRDAYLKGYLACLPRACIAAIQDPHVVLRFEEELSSTVTRLNEWLESAFTVWCEKIAPRTKYTGILSPYVDWEWSLDGVSWHSFANWSCTIYGGIGFEEPDYRGDMKWDFHRIPADFQKDCFYLRARTDSILECIRVDGNFNWNTRKHTNLIRDVLSIRSINEFRDTVSDEAKDWSSFKYQRPSKGDFQISGDTCIVDIV